MALYKFEYYYYDNKNNNLNNDLQQTQTPNVSHQITRCQGTHYTGG